MHIKICYQLTNNACQQEGMHADWYICDSFQNRLANLFVDGVLYVLVKVLLMISNIEKKTLFCPRLHAKLIITKHVVDISVD